jgi:hypothetical protein
LKEKTGKIIKIKKKKVQKIKKNKKKEELMTLRLQEIKIYEQVFLIIWAPKEIDWMIGKTSIELKKFFRNLHGYTNMVLSKEVKAIRISEKTHPEYFI